MTLSIISLSKTIKNATLSTMTFSIMTLETEMLGALYAECHLC